MAGTAQHGLPDDEPGLVRVISGVVQPERNAVWYGLEDDLPGERNYARSRGECEVAARLARARAATRAKGLGPGTVVNDGTDRGSGTFWDLYVGS